MDKTKQMKQKLAPPSDPTANTNNMFADTSGLTGMTQNSRNNDVGDNEADALATASIDTLKKNIDIAEERDRNYKEPQRMSAPYTKSSPTVNIGDNGNNKKYVGQVPPSVEGEQSNAGDMPDPDADDDTLANAQFMGMQPNEDPEHPQQVDIARDIDQAEEYIRSH